MEQSHDLSLHDGHYEYALKVQDGAPWGDSPIAWPDPGSAFPVGFPVERAGRPDGLIDAVDRAYAGR